MDTTREQAITEVMAETGEPYEIVADLWDALVSMHEEQETEAADDDGLTCDPCRAGHCYACNGAFCQHECVSDEYDPADDDRPVVTVELPGISR
ncbi:hypothetical protein [Micromonospora sp. WMMD998]|uniref:hypothetical protein n=1 Tax=Micromonospora sp. WMMD998 TaxID=3016092 RepID=UPI002499B8A1|nr:hypothetical protein [Micromonospora sp. WMMD998]WFE41935.1 hypothetical protein O7619_27205 [Micromonospora sp. WMMD998]